MGRGHGTKPQELLCSLSGFPSRRPQCAVFSLSRPPARLPRLLSRPEGHIAGKPRCHFHLHQQNFMSSVPWMQTEKPNGGTFLGSSRLLSHLPGCLFYSPSGPGSQLLPNITTQLGRRVQHSFCPSCLRKCGPERAVTPPSPLPVTQLLSPPGT